MKILIAGAGLAGACFALECLARGYEPVLVDGNLPGAASRSALGILNPMVPGRWNPVENLERFLPRALELYGEALGPVKMLFRLGGEEDLARWTAKRNGAASSWLGATANTLAANFDGSGLSQYWGQVKGCFRLDTGVWLDRIRKRTGIRFIRGTVDWQNSDVPGRTASVLPAGTGFAEAGGIPASGGNRPLEIAFDRIVCAEGWHAAHNPFWQGLSWKPARGDSIAIAPNAALDRAFQTLCDGLGSDIGACAGADSPHGSELPVLCAGFHFFRDPSGDYRAGSSFSWDLEHQAPDATAAANLVAKSAALLGLPETAFTVSDGQWGIRPASAHRLPVIGIHRDIPHLSILNGMGTRGVLYAPEAARILAAALFDGEPVDPMFRPRVNGA